MAFHYRDVVPWGRSYEEYVRMFDLGEEELARRILGCGDGPASFNAELSRCGGRMVSADPLYGLEREAIERRIDETFDLVMSQTERERDRFVWREIRDVEHLAATRMAAMRAFLADYEQGRAQGRYLAAELPELPFADGEYDLALSAHLLFFYADQLDRDFHRRALAELRRVAREVRIFPLVDVNARPSKHLAPLLEELERDGAAPEIATVPYEFQQGGNEMLLLRGLVARRA
ncbi:MAG: SAM-dependent methyltransferase [Thermoanaerobaculia bacterium]|nr:SAM-dependent methyltransferase [Thermoanaerobaculia bacterium]